MGADSAGVAGYALQGRVDPKLYRVGPMLLGFTSSFRMGQLLGHRLKVPDHDPRWAIEKYMAIDFVDAVRQCLKDGGFAKKLNEVEEGGTFLVAYMGRIFAVEGDYQVGEQHQPYAAVGCGFDLALGSLHTTAQIEGTWGPQDRLRMALEAAETFSAGVRRPFIFESA